MAKVFCVKVNASPKYVITKDYLIEAGGFATAAAKGIKRYIKEEARRKGFGRVGFCNVYVRFISKKVKEVKDGSEIQE